MYWHLRFSSLCIPDTHIHWQFGDVASSCHICLSNAIQAARISLFQLKTVIKGRIKSSKSSSLSTFLPLPVSLPVWFLSILSLPHSFSVPFLHVENWERSLFLQLTTVLFPPIHRCLWYNTSNMEKVKQSSTLLYLSGFPGKAYSAHSLARRSARCDMRELPCWKTLLKGTEECPRIISDRLDQSWGQSSQREFIAIYTSYNCSSLHLNLDCKASEEKEIESVETLWSLLSCSKCTQFFANIYCMV